MRIFRHLISWALALFLIAMFIQSTIAPLPDPPEGSVKLFDAPGQNIVFQTIAERSGVSLFEPAGRFVAAIGFHLSPWLGRNIPVSLDPANTATDGGQLFMLSILMLVASLLVMVVHPGRIRG